VQSFRQPSAIDEAMSADGFALVTDPSTDLLNAVFRLRVRAWRTRVADFPHNLKSWRDAFDPGAEHFVIAHDGVPVAAARLTVHDRLADAPDGVVYADVPPEIARGPVAVISRLIVGARHAGRGLAPMLDRARIERATAIGCNAIFGATNAGEPRVRQLERLGFRALHVAKRQSLGPLSALRPPIVMFLALNSDVAANQLLQAAK
jgi:GNAT superfamily N-acetyltransferase